MSWDIYSKILLKECPQDFVTFFAPGARFIRMRETQFQTRGDSPYNPREMRGDTVIEADYESQGFLIDVEWQTEKDEKMDERLLGYNYEATRLHGLNVLSAVIYLQNVNDVPAAPLDRALPSGRRMLWFDFDCLKLCDEKVATFRQLDLDGFAPLMLLCKDGATEEILEEVLARLEKREGKELLFVTLFFASKVLKSPRNRERLERKLTVLRDFIKDSWIFQQILEEGRVEGIEEGRVEGIEKGRVEGRAEGQIRSIEAVMLARFPDVWFLTRRKIMAMIDSEKLQKILLLVATAQSEHEVEQYLRQL